MKMYVVSYDIESDKVRTKVFKKLKDYGTRVQYSVFECKITEKRCKELATELKKILVDHEGSIRIYHLCAECEKKIVTIGTVKTDTTWIDEGVLVI